MFVHRVPALLNCSQVGLKFIDVMGIRVSHWSLLLRSPEEALDIGMSRPSASSALCYLTHDVIKKTSLCWALYRGQPCIGDICTTNRNCNTSQISISIFMSVTLTYSRSYLML